MHTWPQHIKLSSVDRFFRDEVCAPRDVREAKDLPSRMLLGDLDAGSFRRDDAGWSARYANRLPNTGLSIRYCHSRDTFEVEQVYRGGCQTISAAPGDAFSGVLRSMAAPAFKGIFPWLQESLGHELNVLVPPPPRGCPRFVYFPDGLLLSVVLPVPVAQLRTVLDVWKDLRTRPDVGAPVTGHFEFAASAVNYIEGKCGHPMDDAAAADRHVSSITGCPPLEPAAWETGRDGSRALTVRRQHYSLVVGVFLRDLEAVLRCLSSHGLVGSWTAGRLSFDYPDAHDFCAVVLPVDAVNYELRLFDEARTRRLTYIRSRRRNDPHDPDDEPNADDTDVLAAIRAVEVASAHTVSPAD